MYKIAKLPAATRRALFRNTAAKMHMSEAIVEKDFWVCLTLDYLFHHSRERYQSYSWAQCLQGNTFH